MMNDRTLEYHPIYPPLMDPWSGCLRCGQGDEHPIHLEPSSKVNRWGKVTVTDSGIVGLDVVDGDYALIPIDQVQMIGRLAEVAGLFKPPRTPPPWAPQIRCSQDHDHDSMPEADKCDDRALEAQIAGIISTITFVPAAEHPARSKAAAAAIMKLIWEPA